MSMGVNKAFIFITGFSAVVSSMLWNPTTIAGRQKILSKEDIIDPSVRIVLIADSFQFTEGPVSDRQGNLWFTDIQASVIIT